MIPMGSTSHPEDLTSSWRRGVPRPQAPHSRVGVVETRVSIAGAPGPNRGG